MQEKKANGVYYTPEKLADYLVKYIYDRYNFNEEIDILEPSCGDGVFLKSLLKYTKTKKNYKINIHIIEKDNDELSKAIKLFKKNDSNNKTLSYYCGDYLDYSRNINKRYNLVIGNPPYIKRNLLNKNQIDISNNILKESEIEKTTVMNIWIPFLISAVQSLKEKGILCFVLPAELLQVEYSKEVRSYLNRIFNKIEIFKFSELIFKNIEQDVIVLIGIKGYESEKVIFHKLDNLEGLNKSHQVYIHKKTNNKWSEYYLTHSELKIVDSIRKELNIATINDICRSKVGIVTGANEYFILNNKNAKKYNLKKYLIPIIKKSSYLTKSLIVKHEDLSEIIDSNKDCMLLFLKSDSVIRKNTKIYKYIKKGEQEKINNKYKCSKRIKWYSIPSVDTSDGMFFKRIHITPKIVVNKANVLVTDTAYRIYMNQGYNIDSLVFSFYNSLTLLFVELLGRSYGGGVLELTPNEFKALPIPYINISNKQFNMLDNMLKNNNDIEKILDYTDDILLIKGLGLSKNKVNEIRQIRYKLLTERINN